MNQEDYKFLQLGPIYRCFLPGDKVKRASSGSRQVGEVVSIHEPHVGTISKSVGVCWDKGETCRDFRIYDTDLLVMVDPDMQCHAYDLAYRNHPKSTFWKNEDGSLHLFDLDCGV